MTLLSLFLGGVLLSQVVTVEHRRTSKTSQATPAENPTRPLDTPGRR